MKPANKLRLDIFLDRHAAWMSAALLLQQSLVAASTVLLAKLVGAIHSGSEVTPWLLGYLLTLLGPYVPGALALYLEKTWALQVQWRFAEHFSTSWYSKTRFWGERSVKDANMATFSKEGPALLDEVTTFAYRTLALTLNAGLSVLAVSLAIHSSFVWSYGLGLLLAGAVVYAQDSRTRRLSEAVEEGKLRLTRARMQAWDNLTLGNRYSKDLWFFALRGAQLRFAAKSLALTRHSQVFSVGAAWSLLLPTLALLVHLFLKAGTSSAAQLAIVVALPRVFQILNSSYELLLMSMEAGALRGRWNVLAKAFHHPNGEVLSRIQFSKLNFSSGVDAPVSVTSFSEALSVIEKRHRVTLRGENGAGKSSICAALKEHYGENAFYLPARHELAFASEMESGSTGQRWRSQLEEVLRKEVAPILILDEWDANLDAANRDRIERLLYQATTRGIRVIDVRHAAASAH